MTSVYKNWLYEPIQVGNMWVVTETFACRHNGFIQPHWRDRYWDKDRGLWLIPDRVLSSPRRKLLQQEVKK